MFNKQEITCFTLKELCSMLFSLPTTYQYSSAEAMKENFYTCCDLIKEVCDLKYPTKIDADSKKFKSELTRMKSRMDKFKDMIDYYQDKESVERFIYDVVLSFEGLGRLAGFWMSSGHGDLIRKNPEIYSVTEEVFKR
jgi:hypothetical protein